MSRTPDFSELVGDDLPAEERERLRRVHELLVAAGPPAEVPPSLAEPPALGGKVSMLPRRRKPALALLAATVAAAAFGGGYLLGHRGGDERAAVPFRAAKVVRLQPTAARPDTVAVVSLGRRDASGNWTMLVTVEGLKKLDKGDYYTLYMTRKGKRAVVCGTFNSAGENERTTVRFTVAYDASRFDGWSLTEYFREGHVERELLRA